MRITRFETFLCTYTFPEDERFWGGRWDMDLCGIRFNGVILRVHTDEGITGLGEALPWGDCPGSAARIHQLESRFLGKNPFDVENLTALSADGATNAALAAIDVALWDIVGKATETPVFRLLARDGDVQPKGIRTYASGGVGYRWDRPEQVVEEVRRHKANGFTAFKMRIGNAWGLEGVTMQRFGRLLHQVRAAMGDEMDLMLDGNGRFRSVEEAIEVARLLDDVGARWFEDPIDHSGQEGPAWESSWTRMPYNATRSPRVASLCPGLDNDRILIDKAGVRTFTTNPIRSDGRRAARCQRSAGQKQHPWTSAGQVGSPLAGRV